MQRLLIGLTMLTVVSCAGEGSVDSIATSSMSTVLPTTTASAPPAPAPQFEEVAVESSSDGSYLVDVNGHSLYMFTLDDARTSSCTGACAATWPPLLGDPVAGDGVDPDLLGNAERGNGSIQVTYDGHPLYMYTGDSGPGDTNGHGFNDVWFLIGPDGAPMQSP
jgi:predicted lipoprotein with Yx(FWY)xxD motif